MLESDELRICMDIGSEKHYVGIGLSNGRFLEEFELSHTSDEIKKFFDKIEKLQLQYQIPVTVAMEGYNGHARPIDRYVLEKGYRLLNINNLKLARFKEIFPGPAKSDPIDVRKMFELFQLQDTLPAAKNILQEVGKIPEENERLKRLTRRRRELVVEKGSIQNRLQSDLQAISPGLLSITRCAGNLWFLRFLTCRESFKQLARVQRKSLLKIKGVGQLYADAIQEWQRKATFSEDVKWVGGMIIRDARRILQLIEEIDELEKEIKTLIPMSNIASRLISIVGFGEICAAELAGELGTIDRFGSEASLALYIGMAVLDKKSGKYQGTKNFRSINFRAKGAMMTGVYQHTRYCEESKKYYDNKRKGGKKHNQAVRALGRHMTRVIWSMLKKNRDYELKDRSSVETFEPDIEKQAI